MESGRTPLGRTTYTPRGRNFRLTECRRVDIELGILNPDSGRVDSYFVGLSRNQMTFRQARRVAICTGLEDDDPTWEDEERPKSILKRNSICAPAGFAKMLVRAWLAWRDGELEDATVVEELSLLANWLNAMTRAKPRSEFWQRNI